MNAHWIFYVRKNSDDSYNGMRWFCSSCGCVSINSRGQDFPTGINFCPTCGAHMCEEPIVQVIGESTYDLDWEDF